MFQHSSSALRLTISSHSILFPGLPMFTGVIAVSFSSIFIKLCSASAGAIGMYRLAFTVVLLLPFAVHQKPSHQRISLSDFLWLLVSGILLGLHFYFWIGSLKHTSIASSIIITALQPAFVAIGAWLIFDERLTRRRWLSMTFALMGTLIVASGDGNFYSSSLYGDLLSLLGTIAMSGYMLTGQGVRKRLTSTTYNTIVFATSTILLLGINLQTGASMSGFADLDWLWLVLLALVPTLFGHALFNWLLRYVSATALSVTVLGEPIGAILLAWWLLREPISAHQAIGGIITLFGVALFIFGKRQDQPNQKGSRIAGEAENSGDIR